MKETYQNIITFVIIPLSLCLIGFAIWRSDNPYPLSLNWDIYEHQTLINEIFSGNFNLLNSRISDTFLVDGYSPLFHLILGALQKIVGLEKLGFWWIGEGLFYLATVIVSTYFGWVVGRSRLVAIVSSIIAAFAFESYIVYSPLFLLPQTLSALLISVALAMVIDRHRKEKRIPNPVIVVLLVVGFLLHYIVGLLGAAAVIGTIWILGMKTERRARLVNYLLVASAVLLIALPTLSYAVLDLDIIKSTESGHFNPSLSRKLEVMLNWYGLSFPLLLPLGVGVIIRKGKTDEKVLLTIFLMTLSLVIARIPYSLKFYALTRYLTNLFMAIGLTALLIRVKNKWARSSLIAGFTLVFAIIFSLNQNYYKGILHYGELSTQVSPAEIEAAKWIGENYEGKVGVLIVSDPTTQGIFEAISGVNSQGGVYANLATRTAVDNLYPLTSPEQIRDSTFSIVDDVRKEKVETILLTISGRFFDWQRTDQGEKEGIHFNVWRPRELSPTDNEYIRQLTNYDGFDQVFRNSAVVAIEIEKQP